MKMGDNWSTPDLLFDQLHEEFKFNLDACASDWNYKCYNYFGEKDDAFSKTWGGVVWMNPPYSNCGTWVKKAFEECQKGSTIVCLIPGRVETNWFHDYCVPHEIRFVRGRIHFGDENGKTGRPRLGCVLVIMRPFKYDSGTRSVIQPKGLKIN
jgi:site-specific DNA-methyltransferase (adenine-specific)